jgi:hypothetical protein
MFLIEGVPAILLGIVASMYLVDSPRGASWLSADQKTWLQETLQKENTDTESAPPGNAVNLFPILVLSLVYFGLNTVSYGVSLWLPTLIKSLSGMSNLEIGALSAIRDGRGGPAFGPLRRAQMAHGDAGHCRRHRFEPGGSHHLGCWGDCLHQHRRTRSLFNDGAVLGNANQLVVWNRSRNRRCDHQLDR